MGTTCNIAASIIGRLWAAIMNFAFVPVYIAMLGMEAYGLIGFFAAIMAVFFVLDMGLSTTINREMAVLDAEGAILVDRRRTLLRVFELIYWAAGGLIALVFIAGAPWLVRTWLNLQTLPPSEAILAVRLLGITAFFRWPVALYSGVLMGLRQHVRLNLITSIGATVQGGGAALALLQIAPSIVVFFVWQAIAAALTTATLVLAARRSLPPAAGSPAPSWLAVRSVVGFSIGVSAITLLSVVLMQVDKFVLTRQLPLRVFGHYALASSIAGVLYVGAGAVYSGIFPTFAFLASRGDTASLSVEYHRYCQLLSFLVVPPGLTLAIFAPELLTLYIGEPAVVAGVAPPLTLLALGNVLLSVMIAPLALQFAFGWTRLSLIKNIVAVVVFVPLLLWLTAHHGTTGAAMAWLALTCAYVLIEVPVMHRRLLPGEHWRWYALDVGASVLISGAVLMVLRWSLPARLPALAVAAAIGSALALAAVGCAMALPGVRDIVRSLGQRLPARRPFAGS